LRPSIQHQFLQPLREGGNPGQRFPIIRGRVHEHTDPPHLFGLLRACRDRPCRRHTAKQRNKFSPSYLIELHSMPRQPGPNCSISN